MKERIFDSLGADKLPMHRLAYQGGVECGAVHAIGNGEIMLYGRGPEWMQTFGAPYSCPTMLSLTIPQGDGVKCRSHRRAGTGSWTHILENGQLTDCASRSYHCLARHWELTAPLRFELDTHELQLTDMGSMLPGTWLITAPANAACYNDYPIMRQTYMLLRFQGGFSLEPTAAGLMVTLMGEGSLTVTGAQDYAGCIAQMTAAAQLSFGDILSAADQEDKAFLARCAQNRRPLKEHPLREQTEAAIEDALLMIRAQQHVGGGIQAGHNYHLAYVRDQYGVSRGLIAMGAWDEATAILRFYREIFARHGFVATAQAMGVDGIFHVHENDLTEITGYLLVQACDVYEATGDAAFFRSLAPMLKWAVDAQLSILHNNMLPFNGDETYIAGHIVPRTIENHGSFESTLLFITGGRRYIAHCRALDAAEPWMDGVLVKLDEVAAAFETNFRRGDTYVANSLRRLPGLVEPEFRHGVCCNNDFFGWVHRVAEGWYVCPKCAGRSYAPCREEFKLKSTLLMVPFIGADQLTPEFRADQTARFLAEYREMGRLPSLPEGDLCLGYDFGLMLFAARDAGLDADDLMAHMLSLQDECGAWSEYFSGSTHVQTRCRPWESAINIAGAIRYLES